MLIGTDGGIYESFDDSETWKFVGNLPNSIPQISS